MQTKKDLQDELNATKKRNGILEIVLVDLVREPEAIKWFARGKGASKVTWGIVRSTGASGGYVICREGEGGKYVYANYLDEACSHARQSAEHASSCSDLEQQQIYLNRASLAEDILRFRAQELATQNGA
jgi:hypothetical protein